MRLLLALLIGMSGVAHAADCRVQGVIPSRQLAQRILELCADLAVPVDVEFDAEFAGVADHSGLRIRLDAAHFKEHPDDFAAVEREFAHVRTGEPICSSGEDPARDEKVAAKSKGKEIAQRVTAQIGTDVAALYGERSAAAGSVPPVAVGSLGFATLGAAIQQQVREIVAPAPLQATAKPVIGTREHQIAILESRIVQSGASDISAGEARRILRLMLENAESKVVSELVRKSLVFIIIPEDKKLTELPAFHDLKGGKTFDGREWETVRGVANHTTKDGGIAMAVAEETFFVLKTNYPANFVFVHEFSHIVQNHGLPSTDPPGMSPTPALQERWRRQALARSKAALKAAENDEDRILIHQQTLKDELESRTGPPVSSYEAVQRAYDAAMKRKGKSGLGDYADANVSEYWAQGAAAFFGAGHKGEDAHKLWALDPDLALQLYRTYGTPRKLKP